MEYCKNNDIPLKDLSGTKNLLRRVEVLFNQIAELKANPNLIHMNWLSDERKHLEESDGEVTVPPNTTLKS